MASGCSTRGRWPASGTTSSRPFSKAFAYAAPYSGVTIRSLSPHTSSAGCRTRPRRRISVGSCMQGLPAGSRMVAMLPWRRASSSAGRVARSA
ncbi:hypothetical protein AS200_28015 [Streptomyces sp. CdTB01]|nr:hypothetical protein AS200_28015 [Streptomyces sp. CdTB01]